MTECPHCGAHQPPEARFCNSCGGSLTMTCATCGAVPPAGSRFCNDCGAPLGTTPATASQAPTGPVASRRITSVLFGDLVGFTTLSESRDQEDVRELLSRYFEECSRIVARYGGVVEKFIGDAVMAVWGVPTIREDDAERSVRAGLELVTAAAALGTEIGVEGLSMRVGIVTGEVAVTHGAQLQGMVAGDPVNTASRVQSVAAPGQVWVDETTRLLTSAAISYVDVGAHTLKGKADPMPLWAARAVVAQVGGAARADGLEAPLVGRDRELRMVKELYHRVEETSRPALLLVVGEAGVGKSRLGWEFSKYTDGLSNTCRWHAGKCVSYGEGVAYYALAEAVRSRLETALKEDDEVDQVDTATLIERGLAEYVESPAEREWLAPRLGALLGTSGTSSHQREDLFAAWTTFLERVSNGTEPVVMLIDDAQYADDGLIMFLEHVMAVASFPCLVMLLARPDLIAAHPGLATNRRATALNLEQLTDGDMATLIDGLVEGLPETVRDELVGRAEGVPTFAVETVRALIDKDLVVPRGGSYVLRDPDQLDLAAIGAPASLQALISARLDTLTQSERRVVDRASVAGDSVEPALLARLCADVPDLDQVLGGLVRSQIMRIEANRLSSEQGRYQFVQSALRQVAYATLSRRDRKQAHLDVLELMTADRSDELAPVCAQHCIAAIEAIPDDADVPALTERAVQLLEQAAARAAALGTPREAAGHLRRALDLASAPDVQARLLLAIAVASNLAGQYDEAAALARRAQEAFVGVGDRDREVLAVAELARALTRGPADYAAAVSAMEPWYRQLSELGEASPTFATVLDVYTTAMSRMGDVPWELLIERLIVSEKLGDKPQIARAMMSLAVEGVSNGSVLFGMLLTERSVEVAAEGHDLVTQGQGLANWTSWLNGDDLARALSVGAQALDVTRRCGDVSWMSLASVNLSLGRWNAGEWDAVLETLQSDVIVADDRPMMNTIAALVLEARGEDPRPAIAQSSRRELATYWWYLGEAVAAWSSRDRAALVHARSAVDNALDASGVHDDLSALYEVALRIAVDLADEDLLQRLARVVDEAGALPPVSLRGHRALLAALDPGDAPAEEIDTAFRTALRDYEAWGSPVHGARAAASYAVWLTRHGRSDEAVPFAASARQTFAALGARSWLAELDAGLGVVTGRPAASVATTSTS